MKTRLVGVHKVTSKGHTYFYAWRGGPRIESKPGTTAFVQEFTRLTKGRTKEVTKETIGWLIDQYVASADFQMVKPETKRSYERSLGMLRAKFGTFPLAAIEIRGARKDFLDWRDTMKDTPRAADLHISLLHKIFVWSQDKELIIRNPLEKSSKLHDGGNRKDAIWMPHQLATILGDGAPHLVDVVKMALWTMQRQKDILTMPTIAYDDGRIWVVQSKTGARVRVRPADEIIPILARAKSEGRQRILLNSLGDNWTSDGFRSSFNTEKKRLGIAGVTFHDLRGTGITFAYAHGLEIGRIAEISGHSKSECEGIIRRHYLAGSDIIDAIRSGTKM